jgi:hypothetical protein
MLLLPLVHPDASTSNILHCRRQCTSVQQMVASHCCKYTQMNTYVYCMSVPCKCHACSWADLLKQRAHGQRSAFALWPSFMFAMQKDEDFFACKWTVNEATGDNLLLAAGLNATLRVINVSNETLQWVGTHYCNVYMQSSTLKLKECCTNDCPCSRWCLLPAADSAGPWRPNQ